MSSRWRWRLEYGRLRGDKEAADRIQVAVLIAAGQEARDELRGLLDKADGKGRAR